MSGTIFFFFLKFGILCTTHIISLCSIGVKSMVLLNYFIWKPEFKSGSCQYIFSTQSSQSSIDCCHVFNVHILVMPQHSVRYYCSIFLVGIKKKYWNKTNTNLQKFAFLNLSPIAFPPILHTSCTLILLLFLYWSPWNKVWVGRCRQTSNRDSRDCCVDWNWMYRWPHIRKIPGWKNLNRLRVPCL